MRPTRSTVLAAALLAGLCGPSLAQRRSGFEDQPTATPTQPSPGSQGFSFSGDQLKPSYDRRYLGTSDPRYAGTAQQQRDEARQTEQQRPGGGCLRYGAVGAAGGHLAHHGVVGALAGCAVGSYVRHRDKEAIRAQQSQ